MGCEATSNQVEDAINEALGLVPQSEIDVITTETQECLESQRINIEKVRNTVLSIGQEERLFFIDFFNAPADPDWFVSKVILIQTRLNFPENKRDGVIGPYTLSQIYTRYYIQQYDNLPLAQKTRLDIYAQMQDYQDRNVYNSAWEFVRTISVSSKPNVFDDRRYWWWESFDPQEDNPVDDFRPRQWTMFANWIIDRGFDTTIRREANTIYIEVFQWKHILSLYNENGECELVTYTSPWNASRWANGRYNINAWTSTNLHHMSNDLNWAPMPYGINVSDWNIMIHSWAWVVNGDFESAWCYRVALAPASYIFSRVREMWNFQLVANI